ncbi:MAG: DinB family protein [Gemmatimonadales bacterium]
MSPRYDRPGTDEYAPYYETYVGKIGDDLFGTLAAQIADLMVTLRPVPDDRANTGYAPGKWSIKEVMGHIADTERVMAYRAMAFARGDQTPLPSFDENAWTPAGRFNERSLGSLIDEWVAVRSGTITMLNGLPQDAVTNRGTASGKTVSVRGLAYIIAGHTAHHLQIIKDRYLGS